MQAERKKPIAAFMAFGTKGDVYPIAAIAAAFASDQRQYDVFLITHSAHENLSFRLAAKYVTFYPISSSPVLCASDNHNRTESGSLELTFEQKKRESTREHRKECYSAAIKIFGDGPSLEGNFIVINFFALEGWSLAELFRVRCIVAAPYVVPYSAPASFEHRFTKEHPLLYKYLKEAPINKVCWGDVIHWMWPLFTENWGSWRSEELNLSACPFMDPVTGLPTWYDRASSPKLLYGFSKEIVECPDYWPSSVRVCGFWFLPNSWQYSCKQCGELSAFLLDANNRLCASHIGLQAFMDAANSTPPIFVGLSSVASMGFLKNPEAFLRVLQTVLHTTTYRFVLFTAGYEPLDTAIRVMAPGTSSVLTQRVITQYGISIFNGKLFCFSGMVPYKYLFPRCVAAIHHGGSGSTAAALHAGIPQILCPFMLDQFYWAERMFWLGVAPEPLKRNHLVPDNADDTSIKEAAEALSQAIQYALSPRVKECAKEIAERISVEDGVSEAVKNLKEEMELF
ncbi:sterol 3-beta-glucosyltransferase UGT80B1 [Citrus sinensis]|uniref:sterol 3-beta-glucosyltransferase UGT80B1 n=1 Tax=Citrus sinensis TaxID=2711 RepID=UPI000CED066D|nr:sterol 3-beta-glucosyltransferase UGT80B1 [Citrus sinensis]XP_024040820.1 sterol 3-beta-glucosyltransferase UGT80B1 [Citrus x clementina]